MNIITDITSVTFSTEILRQVRSADAVLIYIRFLPKRPLQLPALEPRDPRQPWIALSFEAPPRANKNFYDDFHLLNGAFNRTMLYRRDADVVVPHGFVVGRGEEADLLPEIWHGPPISKIPSRERKIAVAFISNCKAESGRLEYTRSVQQYISVDIYGKCGPLKCGHSMYVQHRYSPITDKCLMNAGMKYLFYFAFENSLCNDYVTEKLYNILYYPIVPVVLGAANYSTLLPPNSFIDARRFSPVQLATLLRRLSQSPKVCFAAFESSLTCKYESPLPQRYFLPYHLLPIFFPGVPEVPRVAPALPRISVGGTKNLVPPVRPPARPHLLQHPCRPRFPALVC